MAYKINQIRLREGIEELLKARVNEVLDNGGPITFANAMVNYVQTEQLAIKFGINVKEYRDKVNGLIEQIQTATAGGAR